MLSLYLIFFGLLLLALMPIPAIVKAHRRVDNQQYLEQNQLLKSLSQILRRHWRLQAQKLGDPLFSPAELESTKEQIDEILVLLNAQINYQPNQQLDDLMLHWQALKGCFQLSMLRYHHQHMLMLCQHAPCSPFKQKYQKGTVLALAIGKDDSH
ncbi:hypothetical protein ACVFI8_07070 [Agarivorans sp. MS3-6]